jgi:hypothetical protein
MERNKKGGGGVGIDKETRKGAVEIIETVVSSVGYLEMASKIGILIKSGKDAKDKVDAS